MPLIEQISTQRELKGEKNPLRQTIPLSPHPPKSFTEISEIKKAADISTIQLRNRISIGSFQFFFKSHKTVCTDLTFFTSCVLCLDILF